MRSSEEIAKAKAILKESGYYIDNLWSVEDVKMLFKTDDTSAQDILDKSLNNDYIRLEIWSAIREMGDAEGLEEVMDESL